MFIYIQHIININICNNSCTISDIQCEMHYNDRNIHDIYDKDTEGYGKAKSSMVNLLGNRVKTKIRYHRLHVLDVVNIHSLLITHQ